MRFLSFIVEYIMLLITSHIISYKYHKYFNISNDSAVPLPFNLIRMFLVYIETYAECCDENFSFSFASRAENIFLLSFLVLCRVGSYPQYYKLHPIPNTATSTSTISQISNCATPSQKYAKLLDRQQ